MHCDVRVLIAIQRAFQSAVFRWGGFFVTHILFGMKADWSEALAKGTAAAGIKSEMADLRHADLSGFDAVVPLTLWDRGFLAQRQVRGETFNALFPSAAAQGNCDDKLRFNRILAGAGLGEFVPALIADPADLPAGTPIIVKRRHDEWGKLSRIVHVQAGLSAIHDPAKEFLQEYIGGTLELSAHLLLRGGRIIFARTARFEMPDVPHVKGISTGYKNLQWQKGSDHLDLFSRILAAVGFDDGTCCIDFREVEGKPKIFEINPRMGGSLTGNVGDYLRCYLAAVQAPQQVVALRAAA
ncbi:hypothetical protein [Paracoccus thiocyanatus]|uniref:hypothetical protein n=1 Tax=Paracoccus thiocyanatus TaxID=34006 RepID=UPI00122CE3F9|nr:hypothetical protein [Paracoccus thiocyanatus]